MAGGMRCQSNFLGLVLGGARSGKSRHAEAMIEALPAPWVYLATGQAFDEEMQARIASHRAGRPAGWRTVEAPLALAAALAEAGDRAGAGRLPHLVAEQSDAGGRGCFGGQRRP